MIGFRRRGEQFVAELDPAEAQVLAVVIAQVVGLIEQDAAEPDVATDPAIERLFPDGYRDDPAAAAELRELTVDDLREDKLNSARTVLETLPPDGEVRLDAEQADTWLRGLNTALLVIGVRLEITADTDLYAEHERAVLADPTGPRAFALSVHQLLLGLVDSLSTALTE